MRLDRPHVEVRHDPQADVVMFRMWGRVTADDIIRAIEDHFRDHRTRFAIWDFRRVDLNGIGAADLVRIAGRSRDASETREAPRTALVMRDEANFLLGRLYGAVAESALSPIEHRIFFHLPGAFEWLGIENPFRD